MKITERISVHPTLVKNAFTLNVKNLFKKSSSKCVRLHIAKFGCPAKFALCPHTGNTTLEQIVQTRTKTAPLFLGAKEGCRGILAYRCNAS